MFEDAHDLISEAVGIPLEPEEVTVYDIKGARYTKGKVKAIFTMLFFLSMGVNLDHGALPVAMPVLRNDLNVDQKQLGYLGSLVFFGILIGSIAATIIFNKFTFKSILLVTFFGNGLGLIIFPLCSIYSVQCLSRFLSGFC
jgi:predicted MFS family arabinose efflux permease